MNLQNIKYKIVFLSTLLAGATIYAAQEDSITVAVYDFQASGETARDLGAKAQGWNASLWNAWRETVHDFGPKVTALVTANLSAETNLVMVERAELTKALNEQAFGASGMVNSDAAAKIGKITGAKVLIAGQVFTTDDGHITIVASIIGTETSRLFAAKVEGNKADLSALTDQLSQKIAQAIEDHKSDLMPAPAETHDECVERIVKSITGTNRPIVSVNIKLLREDAHGRSAACEEEFGELLLKAGFIVVDENSDQKPDIEITGVANYSTGDKQGGFYFSRGVLEVKVQERRTGRILYYDHQESTGTDPGQRIANRGAQVSAVDGVAERILPLLAK